MRISMMRFLDKWAGVPICALFTLFRRWGWEGKKREEGAPLKIAFIKLAEQGSTVLAYSALRRAVEMAGALNVYFVVFEDNRFILDTLGLIRRENVITIRSSFAAVMAVDVLRAIRRMKKAGVNAVVDMEFFARLSAIMSFLSRAEKRVGFHSYGGEGPYRGNLFTHRLRFNPHIHTSQTFRIMVEALRAEADELPRFNIKPTELEYPVPRYQPEQSEIDEARAILQRNGQDGNYEPLILMNANCSDLLPLRRWPSERYVETAKKLLERYPEVHIAFTGSLSEAGAVEELVKQIGSGRCFSLAGKTTLENLLTMYGLAEVLLTNDSGPSHFAALTEVDVVTLFGPECPQLFGSRTPREHVLWDGIACSPCVSALNNRLSTCKNNECMQNISTEQVFAEVCKAYEGRKKK
jgi:ADP-heptose:LPS heptosyltransferase